MTCSNRWAKPVLPTSSSFEPTWYQTLTAAMGIEWSSCRMTSKPFDSVNFSWDMESIFLPCFRRVPAPERGGSRRIISPQLRAGLW